MTVCFVTFDHLRETLTVLFIWIYNRTNGNILLPVPREDQQQDGQLVAFRVVLHVASSEHMTPNCVLGRVAK